MKHVLRIVGRSSLVVGRWSDYKGGLHNHMDDETKRRLVYGLLSLVLGAIATRLAMYLTNRILGEPEEGF